MARMHLAWIAVIVTASLAAQQTRQGHLTINIVDAAGQPISGAAIAITFLPKQHRTELAGDQEGNINLDLDPGRYRIEVNARAFVPWSHLVVISRKWRQTIVAKMQIDCNRAICDINVDAALIDEPDNRVALATPFVSPHAVEGEPAIRTAHDSAPELVTKAQLERLLAAHDLRQWTFTHEVIIDKKSIPHSHPVLTLHTRHLKQDDELLSTYLHEQLHWFFTGRPAETKAAEQDLAKLYPEVPVGYPEGANDTESTYLHLLVCRLEQQADRAVMGEQRTAEAMQFWAGDHYRWVYRTVLADGAKIDEILRRHGLSDPDARVADSGE